MKFIDFAGNEISFNNCPSCAYFKHEFSIPADIVFENDLICISQDWELPIVGFFIIAPKRHITSFDQLETSERNMIFDYANRIIKILKQKKVCDAFNITMEDKPESHFHVWVMPRHQYMLQFGSITKNIGKIFDYCKTNLKTPDNINKVIEISNMVKSELSKMDF